MFCCPGLVGRGARFASGGSAELVPSGAFLPGGRVARLLSVCPRGSGVVIRQSHGSAGSR